MHHKVAEFVTDYCDYIEHWNGYVGTAVSYPNFYKDLNSINGMVVELND